MPRNSRWPTASLAVMVFITASLLVPVRAEPMRGINVGDSISPRTIKTLAGEKMTIPAKEGITVLVYWATWNPRSRPALSTWEKYAEEYKDQPITVIAVNADHQKMGAAELQAVKDYIEENNVGLPVYVDTGLELYNEIGVVVLPTTLFFHSDGKLVFKRGSFSTGAPLDLKEALEQELGIGKSKEEVEKEKKEWEAVFKPKNNALLYFNLGKQLVKRGMKDKARDRWIIALQRDPGYADPLMALEDYFFKNGRTPEAETALKDLLESNGLGALTDHLSPDKGPVKAPENLESPDSGLPGGTPHPAGPSGVLGGTCMGVAE
ncbi:MAG: redoxin domain-containing protein [Deltaproteobacteria bacterium]|nr:redoxin domain-containing protein [Deltaproteobacteria bacterium]